MQIKQLLKIQSIVEGKAIPSDMFDKGLTYYSESLGQSYDILDMHLVHFIRAFIKVQEKLFDKNAELEGMENFKHQVSDYEKQKLKEIFDDFFGKLNEKRH